MTTPETPVRTILQCLWNLQRHTKIPVTKAKTKMPAKSLMSCDRLIVCIKCRSTNRPELVFNLCEECKHIPTVIITYELRLQFIYHIEVGSVFVCSTSTRMYSEKLLYVLHVVAGCDRLYEASICSACRRRL